MISEVSHLQTQLPAGDLTVTSTDLENYAIDCTGNPTKLKPRFAEFLCSYREVRVMTRSCFNRTEGRTKVVSYVASVTSVVIPKSLWGSPANYSRVLQSEHSTISVDAWLTSAVVSGVPIHHVPSIRNDKFA